MQEGRFVLKSPFKPQGDQPQAIEALARGVQEGMPCQVLLGVTGSGKTYTMASVIERVQRPTLVIAHNKTLAAQLCAEFKEFFPDSAVEYFVSYYDYYQPEAYIASTDTYIEKDSSVNEEIERLRHSATAALRERRDVIVVASVSCIYSMGDPSEYEGMMISLRPGMTLERDDLVRQLVESGADFCIGGACYPEVHPESANQKEDIKYLQEKVAAGCQFLTTQMFFDNNLLYNFLYKIREAGITVPVIPGIMPITNANQIERALKLSGSYVPQRFKSLVDRFGDDPAAMKQAGIAYATDQIIDLYANGITNVHVYSMNKPDVAEKIKSNLSDILGK